MQKTTKGYIIWSLVAIPVLVGPLLIFRNWIIENNISVVQSVIVEDIEKTLPDPPEIIKAVYFTGPSAGTDKKIDELIELSKNKVLNAVVIDIKDYSGFISYDTEYDLAEKYTAEKKYIKDIDGLIKKLHDNEIYTIGRITVFQDPVLANARSDWAVRNRYTGGVWRDRNGLAWINPAASASWDYTVNLALDAVGRGFDELNFDYIRFPSDGDMSALEFPGLGNKLKAEAVNEFYRYLRKSLPGVILSADMFGFVTTRTDDLGIGQLMENAFESFDFISPMVYPSHYPPNYLKFLNPAEHPYEVVNIAMKGGIDRLHKYKLEHPGNKTQFRPWLQDFSLGSRYTVDMVRAQINATLDALGDDYKGFMLWNARNVYSTEVFKK
jgi:hypothetical protein